MTTGGFALTARISWEIDYREITEKTQFACDP
jgi:hypothetical protein